MTVTVPTHADVAEIRRLRECEADLRTQARLLELIPGRWPQAAAIFRLASQVRARRMELLDRCGLL